jgi:hypothetical protein
MKNIQGETGRGQATGFCEAISSLPHMEGPRPVHGLFIHFENRLNRHIFASLPFSLTPPPAGGVWPCKFYTAYAKPAFFNRESRMEQTESLVPLVTAFSANKGGAGKTRQAILTANCLGAAGKKVLVIDMDFNNSATFYYLMLCTRRF